MVRAPGGARTPPLPLEWHWFSLPLLLLPRQRQCHGYLGGSPVPPPARQYIILYVIGLCEKSLAALSCGSANGRVMEPRFVERFLVDTGFAGDLPQRAARRGSYLDDLGRLVVADVRVERGRGGKRELRVALAGLSVGLDAVDALFGESARLLRAGGSIRRGCARSRAPTRSARSCPGGPDVIAVSLPITCEATCMTTRR